jgi:serine protease
MSLGGPLSSMTMDSAIAYARGLGVTLVAAAGNDGCMTVSYPARNANVIAVAATTITNTRAPYSNCGPEIDVAAPGGSSAGGVLSTTWSINGGFTYLAFQGTSMATPHVAGLVALLISRGITGPANIQSVLQSTATDLGAPGFDNEFGFGLVQAAVAVGGGSGATRMCAFSGEIVATTITRQSDVVRVAASGSFTFANAQSGVKSVFVWQDIDGNSSVNAGDAFGRVDNVSIFPGMTTPPIAVTVLTYGTGAPVLSVPGGISCP